MNDAFFKIFKHRVTGSFNAASAYRMEHLLFKEQVDLLHKAEQFIQQIREGILDENRLDELFCEPRDFKKITEMCALLDGYRFSEKLCKNEIFLKNFKFKELFSFYRESDLGLKVELSKNLSLNHSETNNVKKIEDIEKSIEYRVKAFIYPDYKEEHLAWTAENFPREQVEKLISRVRNESENWLIHDQQRRNRRENDLVRETKCLNALLDYHQNLYILVIDIRLINYLRTTTTISEDAFWSANILNIGEIRQALVELSESVYCYSKAERDMRYGLNLHCILYFKYNPKFNEHEAISELSAKIKEKCPNLTNFEIRNWNSVVRKHYSPQAVGRIKKNNTKQIEVFQQWVLNYYLRIDEYLWPKLFLPFELAAQRYSIWIDVKALKTAQNKMQMHIKKNEIPILEIDEKSTWSTRHLSKDAKERINLSKRYYRFLDEASSKSLNYIEIFMETLLDSPFCAFGLKLNDLEITEFTVPILKKVLTRIGRQFLSLLEHYVHIKDSLPYHQLFSEKINFKIIYDFKQLVASRCVTAQSIIDLNTYIAGLREYLNRPLKKLGGKSIASYRISQNNLYQERIYTTTQYLKILLKNDVKTYHLKFHLSFIDREIKQAEFSNLMNGFLHDAKRAKPLYWMAGYLGFWRENQDAIPYAEIIFFLDERCFGVGGDQIFNWIKARWDKQLDKNCEPKMITIKPDETIPSRESRRLWRTSIKMDPELSVLIESVNKERQKHLLMEVIPDFIADCTLQENPHNNIPKVLIKGNGSGKKQKVSKKDSSGTDDPQDT